MNRFHWLSIRDTEYPLPKSSYKEPILTSKYVAEHLAKFIKANFEPYSNLKLYLVPKDLKYGVIYTDDLEEEHHYIFGGSKGAFTPSTVNELLSELLN